MLKNNRPKTTMPNRLGVQQHSTCREPAHTGLFDIPNTIFGHCNIACRDYIGSITFFGMLYSDAFIMLWGRERGRVAPLPWNMAFGKGWFAMIVIPGIPMKG